VLLPEGSMDVETTCPSWFRSGGARSAGRTAEAAPAYAARPNVPPIDRSKIREVTPLQMAAMIYYNRGVDLLAARRFAEAADANAKAVRLDRANATAWGNLLATINNWSIELGDRQRFAEAVDLLRRGLAIKADFAAFSQNYVHVHRQWVDKFCREGRFEEAMALVSRAEAELPGQEPLRQVEREIRDRRAKALAAPSQAGRSF